MDSKLYNSLAEAYAAVYSDNVEETYTVTAADKKGNTPAYQAFKAGKKKKDGTPMYKAADHMKEGVRDLDPEKGTKERKERLEKKRGMKLDDHPQYKKEELEQVDEADSLAAMQARREKRLARQRKQMGTSSTGQDFGHDYGISSAERKKRQQAEFDKFVGKKTQKEELENVEELYKGKHGQSDKEYADSRSQGGKMVSGDSKMSGAEYTHGRRVKAANPGMQPDVGGKTKPKSQGKMDKGTRADLEYRKANLKKEELEASGLFTEEEINAILEADEQFDEAMSSYDRNRKRAAQRAAARNAARAAGKTGVVPGVGYVSPRKERETYTDEKGTVRHKSGAKMP